MTTNGTEERPLPNGWTLTPFGELFEIQGGSQPPKDTFIYEPKEGYIRLLQIRDFGDKPVPTYIPIAKARKTCEKKDVLIARYGASLGRILTGMEGAYNVAMAKVIFDHDSINSRYIFYLLQTPIFQTPIHMISRSAQNGFNKGDVYPIELPLAPLPEQEGIVAEIEKQFTRLDQAVASLRRLQGSLARYKASVLKAACEGRLVPQDPADEPADQLLARILAERRAQWQAANPGKKYKKPVGVEETAVLPDLPNGWVWTNMETLIVDGPTNGLYLPKSKYGEGVPILRIDDYQNGESRSSDELRKVAASTKEIQKFSLRKRDMVINRVNSPSHLGKCLVIEDRNLPSLFESNMMRMALSENASPDFVEFYLQSGNGRARLINNAKWAVNQASINQGDVGSTPIPLPPLAEQERIVAEVERRLSVVSAVEQTITANLSRAERLRQSILHRAFTGQLVPQHL